LRVRERVAKDYLASFHNRCQAVYEKILKIVFPWTRSNYCSPSGCCDFFSSSDDDRREDIRTGIRDMDHPSQTITGEKT
jgi:hypothetical protein